MAGTLFWKWLGQSKDMKRQENQLRWMVIIWSLGKELQWQWEKEVVQTQSYFTVVPLPTEHKI